MMTDRTDDFFIPDNEIRLQEELDYSRVDDYIRSAQAFSRSSYQRVYIIDYFRQNFLYIIYRCWGRNMWCRNDGISSIKKQLNHI